MRLLPLLLSLLLAAACDSPDPVVDAGPGPDAGARTDAGRADAGPVGEDAGPADTDAGSDAGADTDAGTAADAGPENDAGPESDAGADGGALDAGMRGNLLASFCPSNGSTAAGLYRGTLASNTNDIAGCGSSAPGRDGAVRVVLAPGATLRAVYRHAGDGILYLLDSCPVTASCLDSSDVSIAGAEEVEFNNSGGSDNPVYVILDSDALDGPQTFELDLFITP